jgi:hypothetical protein
VGHERHATAALDPGQRRQRGFATNVAEDMVFMVETKSIKHGAEIRAAKSE